MFSYLRSNGLTLVVGVTLLTSLVAFLGVNKLSYLTLIENTLADFRIAFVLKPEPQDPNVLIIGITEDTLKRFPYREPVDHAFLADLLTKIAALKPSAIGMDILFDQATEPEKDEKLKQVIATLPVPLVISYTTNPQEVDEDQVEFLNGFVPKEDRVWANLPEDHVDAKVRFIPASHDNEDGSKLPGFARGLVSKLGIQVADRQTLISWHGAPDSETSAFQIYPAQLLMLPKKLDWFDNITGRVVLIGGYFTLRDQHRTPFANGLTGTRGEFPGIEIHAHAVAQFLEHRRQRELSLPGEIILLVAFAALGALLGKWDIGTVRRFGLAAAMLTLLLASGFALTYYTGVIIKIVEPSLALLMSSWAVDAITGAEAKRQRAFISGAFGRYLNPQLVKQLSNNPDKLQLGGESRDMTLLFCDIRGFTTISEKFDAQGLTRFINRFLTPMTELIMANRGTIDKYMGDAIMAFWNAPLDDDDHALHGCMAALKMRDKLVQLNKQWKAEAEKAGHVHIPVNIGIGLNSGICCVGNVGSDQRFDYSVLGDDVNLASRLEGQSKTYGVDIVIGENTAAKLEKLAVLELDMITVKGKTKPVRIFALVGDASVEQNGRFGELRRYHREMIAAYRAQDWDKASRHLEHCRSLRFPLMMGLYELYEERIANYVAAPPPPDWDGVYVALSK